MLYRYRLLYNELASIGIADKLNAFIIGEKAELIEEINNLKKEVANLKLTYRAYANIEKRVPQAVDPEYLRIDEYNNINIALEESEIEQRKKRYKRNIGWSLVDD